MNHEIIFDKLRDCIISFYSKIGNKSILENVIDSTEKENPKTIDYMKTVLDENPSIDILFTNTQWIENLKNNGLLIELLTQINVDIKENVESGKNPKLIKCFFDDIVDVFENVIKSI